MGGENMLEQRLAGWTAIGAILGLLTACGGGGGGGSSAVASGGTVGQGGFVPSSATSVLAEGGTGAAPSTVGLSSNGLISVSGGGTASTVSRTARQVGVVEAFDSTDGRGVVISSPGIMAVASGGGSTSLEHTRFGVWVDGASVESLVESRDGVRGVSSFVIGDATPVAAMPTGGTASYSGKAVAVELRRGAGPRPLGGSLTATADFAKNRLDARASLNAADGSSGLDIAMPELVISGNGFAGAAIGGGLSGRARGGFAGPAASELGGVFELDGAYTVHGAFAGKDGG